jgi:hypothetical protein
MESANQFDQNAHWIGTTDQQMSEPRGLIFLRHIFPFQVYQQEDAEQSAALAR